MPVIWISFVTAGFDQRLYTAIILSLFFPHPGASLYSGAG
jgi:hypothetical protein